MAIETLTPDPVTPLGPETTDAQVIESVAAEKPQPIYETDEARFLLSVIQDYDRAEEFVRTSLVRKYRKHMYYWDSLQYLAWDELAQDYLTPEEVIDRDPQADLDPAVYAKVVNVYKAHGEILIGALTSGTPTVRFMPKDAEDNEDCTSAKGHTKVAELVQKNNRARLLLMKSLFLLYNQGMVALYNENKEDSRFGTYKEEQYEDVPMMTRDHYCPSCGWGFGAEQIPQADAEMQPGMDMQECPQCNQAVEPTFDEQGPENVRQPNGYIEKPKNRECLEVYGPLNVKTPAYIKDQFATPYLILETEEEVGLMREIYLEMDYKIEATAAPDSYERESRVPTNYRQDFPRNQCTVQRCWLRPWALNSGLTSGFDKDKIAAIKTKYPKGIYVVIINRTLVVEILEDALDEHWTLSENPLSETIHAEPIGAPMIPLQDITNELTNLTLETIEFGIPEVFADPRVIDFDAYDRQEARPGQVSPANAPAGRSLQEGFFSLKPATLSREVELFADRIQNVAQFVMGSYPSIYGGSQEGGSGTAKEYELSKASALQRLSSTWTILQEWWCKGIYKATKSHVANMREDENMVTAKGANYVNVWIRREELSGEVGETTPEVSETFPVSWTQKRDVILNLIQMQNEDIAAVIRHPENSGLVAQIIGVPELHIPGDDSRNKQLYEIAQLLREQPMEGPPSPENPTGLLPSVEVDPDVDEHEVEVEICKTWLRSDVGLDAKTSNPAGRANVLAHMKMHLFFLQMMAPPPEEEGKDKGGDEQMSDKVE
jgi:hypothetical protein